MAAVLSWYLLVTIAGWLAFPAGFRLLKFLPDRGYTLARPLALLVWGYLFWLLASFGVLGNSPGGILVALALMTALSAWLARGQWAEIRTWLRGQRRLILTAEILFAVFFAAWAVVRAANPDIIYTEKPMELAFINAILRSPGFPPFDPWLSGYAISYYYFGYVMVSMLIQLSGVASHIGFNVGIALWFGLTALAGFGIVYNLLSKAFEKKDLNPKSVRRKAAGWALLAPVFILILGNLAGFLDVMHARGIFWERSEEGRLESGFWTWLGIKEFNEPPPEPLSWMPKRTFWLWWRGSRVIQDLNLVNQPEEVIDEFPFFSYLLADMHPHVLGMPFVLLAIGLSLNLFLSAGKEKFNPYMIKDWLKRPETWLATLVLGGLSFLNTWDFPIYVGLFCAAFALARYLQTGWEKGLIAEFASLGLLTGILGAILYLPFYVGFASQAGGLLPSLIFHTRGVQFWVMFGPLLVPILMWMVSVWKQEGSWADFGKGIRLAAVVVAGFWILMLLVSAGINLAQVAGQGWMTSTNPTLSTLGNSITSLAGLFFVKQGGPASEVFLTSLARRFLNPGTWLTLLVFLGLSWGGFRLLRRKIADQGEPKPPSDSGGNSESAGNPDGFVLVLILAGAALTLFPEFFYLRDGFGTRMNTIFKFYFQAWILWALAGSFASAILLTETRKPVSGLVRGIWVVVFVMGLIYPMIMLPVKTGLTSGQAVTLTLDGKAYLQRYAPDEWEAFMFMKEAPPGVVVEAVGPQYNPDFARVATHSGQPTVLGWEGHEVQWRGSGQEMGSRKPDIESLYRSNDWDQTVEILRRYHIRYIYIGPIERGTYAVNENKFTVHLQAVFMNNTVTIYEVPDIILNPEQAGQ